jgi:hypothetical protein
MYATNVLKADSAASRYTWHVRIYTESGLRRFILKVEHACGHVALGEYIALKADSAASCCTMKKTLSN